ncbi:MAG TPA: FKBP-type peptidyl-prolyl cis-trans isomerase [Povalibacter sp.]|jgi:FKBP-type peptidyl-prolyl cis-trans isomerase FkpA
MLRVMLIAAVATIAVGCKPQTAPAPAANPAQVPAIQDLVVKDVAIGGGEPIASGQTAVVHYTGWLYESSAADHKGAKFDSSRDKGQPFRFPVGAGRVIQGWDQGVAGMTVGGRRELIVPARLGYGETGAGGVIPPGATLLFDVELLAIEPGH